MYLLNMFLFFVFRKTKKKGGGGRDELFTCFYLGTWKRWYFHSVLLLLSLFQDNSLKKVFYFVILVIKEVFDLLTYTTKKTNKQLAFISKLYPQLVYMWVII